MRIDIHGLNVRGLVSPQSWSLMGQARWQLLVALNTLVNVWVDAAILCICSAMFVWKSHFVVAKGRRLTRCPPPQTVVKKQWEQEQRAKFTDQSKADVVVNVGPVFPFIPSRASRPHAC